jgi:GNAT superfamily N-acetyltransferase
MNGRDLTFGVVGALAVAGAIASRRGSRSQEGYSQQSDEVELFGSIFTHPVEAFDHIASGFLPPYEYWVLLGVEQDDKADAQREIVRVWASNGVRRDDKVFAWDYIELAEESRGQGMGRATVKRIENLMVSRGVKAIVLQAGQPDGSPSLHFWKKMGYEEWPGDYGWNEDRIMFKVLA